MRTVKVVIEASVAGAIANVKAFQGTISDLGGELDRAAVKHPERLNKIANVTGMLGIGMAVAFGAIVKSAMDFDQQMSHVVSVADDGAASLGAFREAAIAAGRDTAFTATQAGQAEEELAKAGVSTADILHGALTGALNLAAAGTIDLADAATIAAQAMTEFGLSGRDVGHIADVLTAGANKSTADVSGLGMALGQVGGIAHQTGLSLEDTVGVLARFTQGGMAGEEAGTTLKQTLLQLQAPSKEAADLMKHLGINIYDANGQFVGITGVADSLRSSLGGLDQAQRNAALGTIFGSRAIRGATILYQEGALGIQNWIDAVNDSGAAQRTADEKLNNLSGDLHKLLGSLQAVAISSSGGASAGLRLLAQSAEGALNSFLGLPKPVQETATVLLGVSGAGLLATAGLLKVKTTVTGAMEALKAIGPVGERVAMMLGGLGKGAGIAGLVFAGFLGFKVLVDFLSSKAGPAAIDVGKLTDSLRNFAATGKASGEMAKALGADMGGFIDKANKAADEVKVLNEHAQQRNKDLAGSADTVKAYGAAWGAYGDSVTQAGGSQADFANTTKSLDKSLAQLTTAGGATQARLLFQDLQKRWVESGHSIDDLNKLFPEYTKAAGDAAVANSQLGQGFGSAAQNANTLTQGLQDAIQHGETLISVFKQLNGANLDLLDATIKEKQALADLNDKFKQGKDAIDLNTQSGRDNMKLVEDAIKGAADLAQATFNQTGSVEAATAAYNAQIEKLKQELHHLGLTDAQINQIINDYGRMPPAVTTQVNANGADAAAAQAARVHRELDRLDGTTANTYINVITTADNRTSTRGNLTGGIYEHAAVGVLRDADVYSPASPARYAFAEPSTRGEAFIPRSGNMGRSRAIADYVVSNWLGGSTSYGGRPGGMSGGTVVNASVTINAGMGTDGYAIGRQVAEVLRPYISSKGGNVQVALGKG